MTAEKTTAACTPLSFVVFMPPMSSVVKQLHIADSPWFRHTVTVKGHYRMGMCHTETGPRGQKVGLNDTWRAAQDQTILFLQNEEGAKTWPVTKAAIHAISKNFALPSKPSANL